MTVRPWRDPTPPELSSVMFPCSDEFMHVLSWAVMVLIKIHRVKEKKNLKCGQILYLVFLCVVEGNISTLGGPFSNVYEILGQPVKLNCSLLL